MSALQEALEAITETALGDNPPAIPISLGPDPSAPRMSMSDSHLYLHVPKGELRTFTFSLPSTQSAVKYDNPPITVADLAWQVLIERTTEFEATMTVNNSSEATQGLSFFYTLHAIWTKPTGEEIPLRLDPTVHNDPPS